MSRDIIDLHIPIILNKGTMGLHITAEDARGRVVWDGPGRSITRRFTEVLRRYMNRNDFFDPFPYDIPGQPAWTNRNVFTNIHPSDPNHFWYQGNGSRSQGISNVANNGSGLARLTLIGSAMGGSFATGDWVWVSGIEGNLGLNGPWQINDIANNIIDLQGSVHDGNAFINAGAIVRLTTTNYPGQDGGIDSGTSYFDSGGDFNNSTLSEAPLGFLVGRDNRAVGINDMFLYDLINYGSDQGELLYGAAVRTPPAQVGDQVEMTESRQFVNNNPTYPVTIKELGLCTMGEINTNFGWENTVFCWSRDLVNIELVPTASVSITQRIRTNTPTTGGFTRQFLELLWREFACQSREAKNWLNANNTTDQDISQFMLNGIENEDNALPFEPGMMHGIVVGTSVKDVEPADYKLRNADDSDSVIVHGSGAGQLYYNYGNTVDPVLIVGSRCSYKVVRLLENRSGGDVTVNEVGLNVNNISTSAPFCIARHRVIPALVVPTGKALRVTYEFGAEV